MAERLRTLHAAGLVHRDLKPANILWLPRTNSWTIIDFATVAHCGEDAHAAYSLPYAAPEAIRAGVHGGKMQIKCELDSWSLGVIAYELLTRQPAVPQGAMDAEARVCCCIVLRTTTVAVVLLILDGSF